jgi:hypothetical protein
MHRLDGEKTEGTMSDDGRDRQTGRFRPGNAGGPGRPRRATEADYLAALSEAVPMESWRNIVAKALEQAESGDTKAREWLGSYLAGKPTGDALTRLAVGELTGYDLIAEKAGDSDPIKMHFGRMLVGNRQPSDDDRIDGRPRDDDEAIAVPIGDTE